MKSKTNKLIKKFIKANSPYKIDDIISDNYYTMKITKIKLKTKKIKVGIDEFIYKGIRVKTDGTILETPYKNKIKIPQRNIIKRLM